MADEDSAYRCTLDEDSLKVAKAEIYEVPDDRISSVKTFRKWILEQDHIKCPTDTEYLLRFLRGAKFSQLRARELLENTMTAMTKIPEWFRNIDVNEPGVAEYMSKGAGFLLPKRDKLNRRILLIRAGMLDVKNEHYSVANEMRAAFVTSTMNGQDEMTQVHGYVLLFDYSNFTMKHMKASYSMENSKKQSKVWQDCTPGRVKALHFYNAGAIFETIMTLSRPFMKKKTSERIHVHENLESLYKHIPMECLPTDYLPDDYNGPTIGSAEECARNYRQQATTPEFRQKILYYTKPEYGIDLSKKAQDVPQESFRKLNID